MQRTVSVVTAALFCLSGCDVDIFGLDWKRIGGGYSLVLSEVDDECSLIAPHEKGGTLVCEVGWRKPLILTRVAGSENWQIIDTSTGEKIEVSNERRKADSAFRDIPVYQAKSAWNRLNRFRSAW